MSECNLRALRQARGWSQKELALRAGVTQAMVSYFERDNPAPKGLVTARQLAMALEVPVDSLWAGGATTEATTSAVSGPREPSSHSAK